jgi:hypothetical protein
VNSTRLDLYELGKQEPVGYIDWEGVVHFNRGGRPPQILFADVPVCLHLSLASGKGISLAPLSEASELTRG